MNDIAFKVIIKNDGIDDVIFKTIMLKGEKGDKGDAGETEIDDSTTSATKTWSSQKINSMIAQTETIEDVAIASFSDGADDVPVSELIVDITAVQAGSGVPSPDNEREISGFDSGIITRCGKNRLPTILADIIANNTSGTWNNNVYTLNGVTFTPTIDANGNITDITVNGTATQSTYFYIARNLQNIIPSNNTMKMGGCANGSQSTYAIQVYFDAPSPSLTNCFNGFVNINSSYKTRDIIIVIRSGYVASNLKFYPMVYDKSETDISFVSYIGNNYTFAFGQTVYGGYFDNKGNLVITYAQTDINSAINNRTTSYDNPVFYGSINGLKPQSNNSLCECFNTINGRASAQLFAQNSNNHDFAINSFNTGDTIQVFLRADEYTDVASLKSACGNSKIIYELANPITLAITSQDVATLLGNNNIFADTGNINKLGYFKTGSEAVARMIEAYMRASN